MWVFDYLLKHYTADAKPRCPDCGSKGKVAREVDGLPQISTCERCQGKGKLTPTNKISRWQLLLSPNTLIARVKFWMATWEMIKEHPFFGHGLNSYKLLYPRMIAELDQKTKGKFLDPEHFPVVVSEHSHCDWLEEISELGFVGFLLLVSIFGLAIYAGQEPFLVAGLISILVAAAGFFPLREAASGLCIWALAGLLC